VCLSTKCNVRRYAAVHDTSYHSVDGVGKAVGLRKTVLVNWYDR
jgi:hypothetical protein